MNGKRFHPRGMIKNRKRERDINYRVRFITFSSSPRNKAETQELKMTREKKIIDRIFFFH